MNYNIIRHNKIIHHNKLVLVGEKVIIKCKTKYYEKKIKKINI